MFTKMNLFSKWAYASVKNHPSSSENYAGQVGGTRPLVAVLLLFLLSCSACSDTKPQTDSDNDSSLSDSDSDLVADSDSPNTDRDTDAEVLEVPDYDCDILPDYDFLTDEDQEPVCLSLKDRDNVRKAGFPFKDDSGQVHFCRKGCDTPTENDPHCVRNLWEWSNFGIYTHYKASQTCYPWPCKMTMKPYYYPETSVMWETHMCDIQVSPKEWSTSVGIVRDLELYKDRAGLHLGTWAGEEYPGMIITEYNVKDETFHQIGNAVQAGYDNDRFIFEATDANYQRDQNYNSYIISASGSGTNYKYEVIYTDKEYQSAFTYPPIVGETWVVIQIKHKAISLNTGYVLYAKVGEWKWTVLTEGLIYDGNIVD
ncbi:hypothetical protein KAH37_08865, partial [bacterium]|nr:hypothetical protein [bacterium]